MKKITGLLLTALLIWFTSCKKDDFKPRQTTAQKISNNWWVTITAGGVDLLGTSVLLTTYNESENKDSIWIDDLQNIWPFKCKAKADLTNGLTFQTESSQNEYYDIMVKIDNGKILPDAGHSKSGILTDSIYMEAKFSDDPTNKYIISGTARTGFAEDDY